MSCEVSIRTCNSHIKPTQVVPVSISKSVSAKAHGAGMLSHHILLFSTEILHHRFWDYVSNPEKKHPEISVLLGKCPVGGSSEAPGFKGHSNKSFIK